MTDDLLPSATATTSNPALSAGPALFRSGFATNQLTVGRRAILILISGLIAYLGVMPAALCLNRPRWSYLFSLIVMVISAIELRHYESVATENPSALDYIAAFLSNLLPGVSLGVLWLLLYWILYPVAFLVRGLLHLMGKTPNYTMDTFSLVISVTLALLVSIALPETILKPMSGFLYPNAAGVKPAFRRLPLDRRKRLLNASVLVLSVGMGLGLLTIMLPVRWLVVTYAILLFLVMIISASMWESRLKKVLETEEAAAGIDLLFQSLGFQVIHRVATGDPEVNPLLVELDLVAWRASIAFAVKLKIPSSRTADKDEDFKLVTWEVGPVLLAAASALKRTVLAEITQVVPMLILSDREAHESLKEFAQEERIVLWECSAQLLREVRDAKSVNLAALARKSRRLSLGLDFDMVGSPDLAALARKSGLSSLVVKAEQDADETWSRTESQCQSASLRERGPATPSPDENQHDTNALGAGD